MKRGWVLLAGFASVAAAMPAISSDLAGAASQSTVYLGLGFGGSSNRISALHYGFMLDRAQRAVGDIRPPLLTMDFGSHGFRNAFVAGVPVASMKVKLSQTDTGGVQTTPTEPAPTEAAPAETAPSTEAAPAEGSAEAAPAEEKAWYNPTGWGWKGWGLAAVGVGGVAVIALGGGHSSSGDGGSSAPPPAGGTLCAPNGTPQIGGTCTPVLTDGPRSDPFARSESVMDAIVDAGTGAMGDLLAR